MNTQFINPYNFVPLDKDNIKRTENQTDEKLYTGKIEYTMKTLTPLFIPNTASECAFDVKNTTDDKHQSFDFYSYNMLNKNDRYNNQYFEPVIPGSEIRGMIRSVYETITNSCMSSVNMDAILSKRTPERFQPGIIYRTSTGYEIFEAKDYLYRKEGEYDFAVHSYEDSNLPKDGSKVFFRPYNRKNKAKPLAMNISETGEGKEGFLIKGGEGPQLPKSGGSKCNNCPSNTKRKCSKNGQQECFFLEKHCAHIFEKANDKLVVKQSSSQFKEIEKNLDRVLNLYKKNADEKDWYSEYRNTWKNFKLHSSEGDGFPIYFSIISNTIIYVSPACITREVYYNTMKKILGVHSPCNKKNSLCPACSLFGTVNKDLQVASSVRFVDAKVTEKKENKDYYDQIVTLPELSSPKLSSTEFYLKKPEVEKGIVVNWTYDYYIIKNTNGEMVVKTYVPTIAGRKYYWHNLNGMSNIRNEQDSIDKNERNRTVRPVKSNQAFSGEVYFEKITKEQLNKLIAILNVSNYEESDKYAYKLGSGKSVGLGSVSFKIDQVEYRSVELNADTGYVQYDLLNYNINDIDFRKECYNKDIINIFEVNAMEKFNVHYPYVEDKNEEGFNWFSKNRVAYKYDNKAKKVDFNKPDKGPGKRIQVVYKQYMEAGKNELLNIDIIKNTRSNSNKGIEVTITAINSKNTAASFKINGTKKSIKAVDVNAKPGCIDEVLAVGDKIVVEFFGKEPNGFEKYKMIKKL